MFKCVHIQAPSAHAPISKPRQRRRKSRQAAHTERVGFILRACLGTPCVVFCAEWLVCKTCVLVNATQREDSFEKLYFPKNVARKAPS